MGRKNYITLPKSKSHDNVRNEELQVLHMNGTNPLNSHVVIYDNGVEEIRLPNRGITEHRFDSKLPPVRVKVSEGRGETRTEVLGGESLPDIRKGVHPLKQIVFKETTERSLNLDEIKELFFETGLEWFERSKKFEGAIKSTVMSMLDDNAIVRLKDGSFRSGILEANEVYDFDEEGYDVEEGIYPLKRLIWDKASEYGTVKKQHLKKIVEEWNWVKNKGTTKIWMDKMIKEGTLLELERGRYSTGDTL